MKFRAKLFLGFGIILSLLFIQAGLSMRLMTNISGEIKKSTSVYLPIQTEATWLRGNIFSIPGFVNLYLNTGQQAHWRQVDDVLKEIFKQLAALSRSVMQTGLAEKSQQVDKISATLTDFEKNLRATYANNEGFIATRQDMLTQAAGIANRSAKLVTTSTELLETAARNDNADAAARARNLLALSSQLNSSVGMLRAGMLRSLATQDRTFVGDNFKTHFPAALQALGEMPKYLSTAEDSQNIQALLRDVEAFKQIQEKILLQWDKKDALAETRNALRESATTLASAIAADSTEMQKANMGEVTENLQSSITQSLIIAAAALIAGIAVALYLTQNMLKQLGKDPGELGNIARRVTQGDYNIDDGSMRQGVYGNIVVMVETLKTNIDSATESSKKAEKESLHALEAMKQAETSENEARQKTKIVMETVDRLEAVSCVVSSASAELSAQIEQSERGASVQAARVSETATAMEEMNSTVLEVAQNASLASQASAGTRSKAEVGARVVHKAVESIQEVQRQSNLLKKDMVALGENAQSINQIMGVISDIADQTNLLALNAAIEAARAGDAGRGFAVVADEVRKLAEKTMASTTDVGNAIKAIQLSADKSMNQVDAAVQSIEQATEFVNQSGAALSEIVQMVDSSADQVRAIATASEEQSSTSEEINRSMVQVDTIASETARAMAEAAKAVSDLANQSHVLTQLIEELKKS